MKKDYNETDPERKIFGAALNSLQIQPSEKFWNSALHGIIDKENVINKKRVQTWKGVSFALATGIVLFAMHDIWVNSKMNKIEEDIIAVKNNQNTIIEKENTTKNILVNANTTNNNSTRNNVPDNVPQPKSAVLAAVTSSVPNQVVHLANRISNSASIQNAGMVPISNRAEETGKIDTHNNTSSDQRLASAVVDVAPATGKVAENLNGSSLARLADQGSSSPTAVNAAAKPVSNSNSGNAGEINNAADITKAKDSSVVVMKQEQVAEVKKQSDSSQTVAKTNVVDSSGILAAANKPPGIKINIGHRVSVSAFFAPGGLSDFLNDKDNDNDDNVTVKILKARETDWFSYQAGIKLGFDISDKLTLRTGLYYDSYSYNIQQSIIKAQAQQDGSVGYSLVTSSGIINVPYNAPVAPKIGDSIKVRGSSVRGYLSIPLQFLYKFYARNKLAFYAEGGLATNIAFYSQTSFNWQNTSLQEGNSIVPSAQGLESVSYSYSLGFGATYKLWRGLSVYAEPSMQGSITSINKGAPISVYPYFFGAAMGIGYHF